MSKIPTFVIVGRPNVGKSTLFNRIYGERLAVVENQPGITRDRLYADCEHNDRPFKLVDTGGILFSDDDPLILQIRTQADVALAEADVILFIVDTTDGIHPDDIEVANHLRGMQQPILVLANKADNQDRAAQSTEFYGLGRWQVIPISALNNIGVSDVLDIAFDACPKSSKKQKKVQETKIAIVGRPNVGKSSLLNAYTGTTRSIVSDIAGTTRDAIDSIIMFGSKQVRLIDTAGLRRKGKIQGTYEYYMALRSERAIMRSECTLVLIDASDGLTDGDKRTAHLTRENNKACVLVVNKWDKIEEPDGNLGISSSEKKEFVTIVRNELPELKYAPIVFASAQQEAGLKGPMNQALAAIENWKFRIPTGALNKIIKDALFEKPYQRKGKSLKIYYATQFKTAPPMIALICNDPELAHFSYLRYLENKIREVYPLTGTPIKFTVKHHRKESE